MQRLIQSEFKAFARIPRLVHGTYVPAERTVLVVKHVVTSRLLNELDSCNSKD